MFFHGLINMAISSKAFCAPARTAKFGSCEYFLSTSSLPWILATCPRHVALYRDADDFAIVAKMYFAPIASRIRKMQCLIVHYRRCLYPLIEGQSILVLWNILASFLQLFNGLLDMSCLLADCLNSKTIVAYQCRFCSLSQLSPCCASCWSQ